jgi:hypothetical protein
MSIIDQQLDSDKFLLYAINVMLQCINELPLNDDEDLAASLEGQIAQSVLIETKKQVLSEEWHFNTDYGYPFAPDANGYIPIPSNVLDIVASNKNVIMRNWKLYDKDNFTYHFDDPVECDVVWDMDFNELTHPIRYYINVKAARIFQGRMIGDRTTYAFTSEDEENARYAALDSESRTRKPNMLESSFGRDVLVR